MERNFVNKKALITLLTVLCMLLQITVKSQNSCEWAIDGTPIESTCAANGKISVTLTGANKDSVKNILYSLEPIVTGGYTVSPNTSPLFENVPAGQYRVVATGVCNGDVTTATKQFTVPGSYLPFTAVALIKRGALNNCNTGQVSVSFNQGKPPYSIVISSAPASYAGIDSFSTASDSRLIDSLNPGVYAFTIMDACGSTAALQTVTVGELPPFERGDFNFQTPQMVGSTCNAISIKSPSFRGTDPSNKYNEPGMPLTYSISYGDLPKTPYKKMYGFTDTITFPAGQTYKDYYGKNITYYVKSPCGEEIVLNMQSYIGASTLGHSPNCGNTFSMMMGLGNGDIFCYPIYTSVFNTSTNTYWYDTLSSPGNELIAIKDLPYGEYIINRTMADGFKLLDNYTKIVEEPTGEPYSAYAYSRGSDGNDGAVAFQISKKEGFMVKGTTIQLISPSQYIYSATIGSSDVTSFITVWNAITSKKDYFYPGNYVFRVTDSCGVYDLPIVVTEEDVHRYTLNISQEDTCGGLKIIPTGTCMYNGVSQPVYFQILGGPNGGLGYDSRILPAGSSFILPSTGTYKIGIGAAPQFVGNYDRNVKSITYTSRPLAVDINNSIGWVCPGAPDNSGSISAVAINGVKTTTGVFTYQLAAAGQGITGPYLATNTTGKFSTATSGGAYTLIKNQNYDIRVEDECGAAAVQTIKIIDFATAQIASSDKREYCVGEEIRFKIINLPTSAVEYSWTGPNGFTSHLQNPVIKNIKETAEGLYHVVINSDICLQPILGDVDIKLVPIIVSCYSAVTDTSVNPYAHGLLGNWRPSRSYAYYGPRAESDPAQATDIRHDGAFDDFMAFWKVQADKWTPQYDTTKWVWNAESTIFNKKGFELENKDALGRYNAGLYGYDNAIPVAVVQNSRYQEAAFEGFEDYGFGNNACEEPCATERRADFSIYQSNMDTTERHTGKYSLRVTANDTVFIKAGVADAATDISTLTFNMGANNCSPAPVLKSVRVNSGVLIPTFIPLTGKKILLSAWVKEEQDCKCTSYTGNQITLTLTGVGGTTTVIAKPSGSIIEGWQRYEEVVDLPAGTTNLAVRLEAMGSTISYFDDIRIHPYNANMKSFVYDPQSLRLMAELDENNYATFYEYDDDGTLTRVKKETERGVKTIKETRSALIKE